MTTKTGATRAKYTQLLPKGAALLPETRALLLAWNPGESGAALAHRVTKEDILGKHTARRARDVVKEVFAQRFLQPTDQPARHLKQFVEAEWRSQDFSDLVFYFAARRDKLLWDFTSIRYWPLVDRGRQVIRNQDVLDFLWEAEQDERIPQPWSPRIKIRLAGSLLTALTQFGLLRLLKPGVREVIPYRLTDEALIYLVYSLHLSGVTDGSLPEHETWSLLGMAPAEFLSRLEFLGDRSFFVVQRAGEVVRITWTYDSMEDVVRALTQ